MKLSSAERNERRVGAQSIEAWEVSPADPTGPRFRIDEIYPCVDNGRYPVKRIAGESVEIWADIFREGHDVLAAALIWRNETWPDWQRSSLTTRRAGCRSTGAGTWKSVRSLPPAATASIPSALICASGPA